MRSCTPGNERALSVKTVPRIRKSFTWLYFFLSVLLGVAAGVFNVEAELGGGGAASCTCVCEATGQVTSAAVQRMVIHRGRCMRTLLASLDGDTTAGGCQVTSGVLPTPRLLPRLPRHHHHQCDRRFPWSCRLLPRLPLRPHHL